MKRQSSILTLVVMLGIKALSAGPILYDLAFDTELYKRFHIKITVENVTKNRLVFSMPIWMPGSYYVKNYGENVLNFSAWDERDSRLKILPLSSNDWEVLTGGAKRVSISYEIVPNGHNFLGAELDSSGALVHGASTWMYVRGFEDQPAAVRVTTPGQWDVATAMVRSPSNNLFLCENYHQLVDSPLLVGALRDTTFYLAEKEYQIAFRGKADFRLAQFTDMVKKIITYQTGLMHHVPYQRYVFLYTLLPDSRGGGGLEHGNSTSIGINSTKLIADISSAAGITAHEFFHLWNVKRLTSDQILPMRYDREARTTSLWWLEGVTSYYTALTLVRSAIWTTEKFKDHFVTQIRLLQQNPDRLKTSLARASWRIWENGYYSGGISYYNKGQLVGFLLDIMIRKVTDNAKSLDDVLSDLYQTYAMSNRGFPDGAIQKSVEKVSGRDFSAFFDRYITGTVELPFREIMQLAGFDVRLKNNRLPSIGRVRFLGKNNRIYSIDTNSSVSKAGIRKEDEIISINGQTFSNREDYSQLIAATAIGDTLKMRVRRQGVYLLYEVPVEAKIIADCSIQLPENISDQQKRIREGILTGF